MSIIDKQIMWISFNLQLLFAATVDQRMQTRRKSL